jgi:uncharacterized membrane protein
MWQHLTEHLQGAIHVGSAFAALISGALVLSMKKGTRTHRRMGYAYFISMLVVNVSALLIYELFLRFGPFHVLALFSLASVLAGLVPAWWRAPGWQARHARFVTGSYVGLRAAAVAETSSHFLALPFGPTVIISSTLTIVVGVLWMRISLARRFPHAI